MIKKKFCNLSHLKNKNFFKSWVKEFRDEIIVFKYKNKIYAKSSICPHFGGPISYDKEKSHLYCFWHGLKFSIDGKCLNQKSFKTCLNKYDYEIINDSIYILKDENS